ncbi:tRNA (uracil-5-)-methyltransferase TRM9 [Angomonas deanei]|uniref:Methyltransferase domain containing protein, putative n=1 Tax=Angomonas deanei TaxID=59799 RepID=A0A7G2C3P7_9TRYP|nr:tRNA (uracil-5-)-methyltransferase TRM9 [Angomonas deanei]CAD2214418.1 Methyltransferase domain containing protein, putative [Angomonas deanei]|eukprot:EPY34368.1 tRNA (uracil-5-)-methyltransferase TRM9 [Angomonas deanei]
MGFDYSHALLQRTQRDWVDPNVGEAVPPTEALPVTDVLCADGRRCPLRDGMADAAISIAVIHHYSTPERRKEAIQELLRVVKPDGGLALIYVWAVEEEEQTNRDGGKRKKSKKRAMDKDTGDALVRWEVHEKFDQEKKVYQRYYHFFKKGELEALALEAAREMKSACTVKESYFDRENWCILLERH